MRAALASVFSSSRAASLTFASTACTPWATSAASVRAAARYASHSRVRYACRLKRVETQRCRLAGHFAADPQHAEMRAKIKEMFELFAQEGKPDVCDHL